MKFSFRSLLMRWLNRNSHDTKLWVIELDGELLYWLGELAAFENRPEGELAGELLTFALIQRQAADENLRIWRELSPREQEVAALVSLGYTNREIASRLVVSPETVKTHTQRIMQKFRIKRKYDLRIALAQWDFGAWDQQNSEPEPEQ